MFKHVWCSLSPDAWQSVPLMVVRLSARQPWAGGLDDRQFRINQWMASPSNHPNIRTQHRKKLLDSAKKETNEVLNHPNTLPSKPPNTRILRTLSSSTPTPQNPPKHHLLQVLVPPPRGGLRRVVGDLQSRVHLVRQVNRAVGEGDHACGFWSASFGGRVSSEVGGRMRAIFQKELVKSKMLTRKIYRTIGIVQDIADILG